MNRIVLIGNGFDLAHGLKTSYKNFIDWYWNDWGEKLLHGLNKTETDGLCSFMIKDNVEVLNWASVFQGWYYRRENPLIPWNVNDVIHLETVVKSSKIFVKHHLNAGHLHHCFSGFGQKLIVDSQPPEVLQP